MVAEIETDKTSVPVPSPAAGVIVELMVADGSTVKPGTNLFSIKVGGERPARRGDRAVASVSGRGGGVLMKIRAVMV